MIDRRGFLRTGALASAGLFLSCSEEPQEHEDASIAPTADDAIALLSTWDSGRVANERGWEILRSGGTILDAVEKGVMRIEADLSNRSVGLGGHPDRDGHVTLDACIQDHAGRAGSVCFLEDIEHPISVARAIMEHTPHVMLVGSGAKQWALANGFSERKVLIPEVREAWKEWLYTADYKPIVNIENHDTIGFIGRSASGQLAGSCSTSGMRYKLHGRVGDSPIIGAGLFVDGDVGAACATGVGELVIRTAGSAMVVERMRSGATPTEACRELVLRIMRQNPELENQQVGFLAIDKHGNHGAWSVYDGFTYCTTDLNGVTTVRTSGSEKRL